MYEGGNIHDFEEVHILFVQKVKTTFENISISSGLITVEVQPLSTIAAPSPFLEGSTRFLLSIIF